MTGRDEDLSAAGRWVRDLARAAGWHRRLLAAGLLAAAFALALHAVRPAPPDTVPALLAARDLAAGHHLGRSDVVVARRDAATLPAGALTAPTAASGSTLVSAVRRGEVLTDLRLLSARAVQALPDGLVATPVRIADPDAVALLVPGATVDVLAAGSGDMSAPARLVASRVRVITTPRAPFSRPALGLGEGALVVLATSEATAARLAGAAVAERLTVVLRGH